MRHGIFQVSRYILGCVAVAFACAPIVASAQAATEASGAENGHSARPLWVLLVQRGPDNGDAITTASFYTKAACEEALRFLRDQQDHPRREFNGVCLPSGAA